MLQQFGKLLGVFPFSKLAKRGPALRIYAIQLVEPPLFEREFPVETDVDAMLDAMRDFLRADCACEIDTFWDLWQYDGDWKLRPAPLTLACYGPDFESEHGDHLRIEFGRDALFLPNAGVEGSLRMGQSNLKSLLHLVGDLERVLDIESRKRRACEHKQCAKQKKSTPHFRIKGNMHKEAQKLSTSELRPTTQAP